MNSSSLEQGLGSSQHRAGIQMPAVRRLYDSHHHQLNSETGNRSGFDLATESLSVREQAASLSSRAVLEGMLNSPDTSGYGFDGLTGTPASDASWIRNNSHTRQDSHTDSMIGASALMPSSSNGSQRRVSLRHYSMAVSEEPFETTPLLEDSDEGESLVFRETRPPLTIGKLAGYLPSVVVGVLLNILDGLSYGMILFPIGATAFAGMESVGLSMFYVSTIVAQLVYSFGASRFPACVGSEMIEIVPFFHAIATTIATRLADESKEAILATTITAFAVSSVVTGLVFFLLGYLRLGTLVGFFPRHILVGCIGGVGLFLVATGIEVSVRLESTLQWDLPTLKFLLHPEEFIKLASCLGLAVALMWVERKITSPLAIPGILIATFVAFHVIVFAIPNLSLDAVRDAGWVFPAQDAGEPWYYFYELYKPGLIHVRPILETFPVMLALTFFGIIHVPINIPALAAATKNDDVNVNAELIAHGISNTLSGFVGAVQNYLVYTNSVMFIKSGADSHIAGLMLAAATAGVMFAGPVIIGYIPVIAVASLIFLMGFDLMAEALVDTWHSVGTQEYATIMVIVFIMGCYDFVAGIVVGIILACLFFVITSARSSPIKATFTGEEAHSTVIRHPMLQRFLSRVGQQVYVIKLQGPLFFGTNVRIERVIQEDILEKAAGIKFLVVDLGAVTDIDYCTADSFSRLKRRLDAKRIRLILSGASDQGDKIKGLRAIDLVQIDRRSDDPMQVRVFPTLNTALEWCENQFVEGYYRHRASIVDKRGGPPPMFQPVPRKHGAHTNIQSVASSYVYPPLGATPRAQTLRLEAENLAREDIHAVNKYDRFQPPQALLMQVADGVSHYDEEFWSSVAAYFDRAEVDVGTELNANAFMLIESGILQVAYPSGFSETMLAGTACGELQFFGQNQRDIRTHVTAEAPSVVWFINDKLYGELCSSEDGNKLAAELQKVAFHVASERFTALTQYIHVSG